MAQLPNPFNAHQVDPAQILAQLSVSGPEGHPVIITASEFKPTKGNAQFGYLELTLQVIDGPHKGETGPYRLNLFHENAQTVEIASRQLSAICHVCNQMMISDSSQLHNIPFRAVVGLQKKSKPEDPDYTQVNGVLDINGNKPGKNQNPTGAAPSPFQQSPAQAQPQPGAAPWGQQGQQQPPQPGAWAGGQQQPQPQPQPGAAPWGQQPPAQAPAGGQAPPWATR